MTSGSEIISKIGHKALELIWNNTNDAIFTIGYDGAVLTINRAFTDILGWDLLDLKEVTFPPFFISKEVQQEQLHVFKQGIYIIHLYAHFIIKSCCVKKEFI